MIKIEFNPGEIVYIKSDPDQLPRMVVGGEFYPDNKVSYRLMCGTTESFHWPIELSREKDLLKSLNID